jgi:hypothetical protein
MSKKKLGASIKGMGAPNHNVELDWALKDPSFDIEKMYPVLEIKVPKSKGSGESEGYAFFDYSHPNDSVSGKIEPPTWLDPVIFVEMADKVDEIRSRTKACVKQGYATPTDIRKLEAELQKVFEDTYLVYVFEKFANCRKLLAQWLLAHYNYLSDNGDGVLPNKKERTENLESRRLSRLEKKERPNGS